MELAPPWPDLTIESSCPSALQEVVPLFPSLSIQSEVLYTSDASVQAVRKAISLAGTPVDGDGQLAPQDHDCSALHEVRVCTLDHLGE